jgi:hypothetical protein
MSETIAGYQSNENLSRNREEENVHSDLSKYVEYKIYSAGCKIYFA